MGNYAVALKLLLLIGKGTNHHQTCTQSSPGRPALRMCSG